MLGSRLRAQRDRRLLRRLAKGEARALAALYDRHGRALYSHGLWLLGRPQDAEDVVQSVFVKLAQRAGELGAIRHPAAYLHRMARREAVDLMRRRDSRPEAPLESLLFEPASGAPEQLGAGVDLGRCVALLPPEQREAVYLRVCMGLKFREIGQVQQVSTNTAAGRYRLALARLREAMQA
jgi:RNA polymerase sigma-70 factor (ECF subfamily)